MKSFKRIAIALILCLMMSPAALAASGSVDISKTESGEDVIYSFSLSPNSEVNAADIVFSYDASVLEYVGYSDGPLVGDGLFILNPDTSEHTIYAAYASLEKNTDGGTLFNLKFKKLANAAEDQPSIGVYVENLTDYDGNALNVSVTGDSSVVQLTQEPTATFTDGWGSTLNASTETINVDSTLGTVKAGTDTTASDEQIVVTSEDGQDSGSHFEIAMKPKAFLCLIIGIVVVIVLIRCFVKKKKKEKADQADHRSDEE